jgi:glycosyltransferase involved in cell wall biosynthesis
VQEFTLRVLITNSILNGRTGTEIVVRDLCLGLKRAGHDPEVYSPSLGPIAEELHENGVPVATDIRQICRIPDVIHGQHHVQTLAALLRFPETPAVVVCHDFTAWQDEPLIFPRVLRYVAVDHRCKLRFERNPRIRQEKVRVILNAVDLQRFKPRGPLPETPRRALIFSNYATRRTHEPAIRRACKSIRLNLEVVGAGFEAVASEPERVLPAYDIVFAKARCALEAMAVGSAVVLCDSAGLGAMVNQTNFADFRKLNFGAGTLTRPLEPSLLAAEIQKYDPEEAQRVSERVRKEASLDDAVSDWISLYEEVRRDYVADHASQSKELEAILDYLASWNFESGVAWEYTRFQASLRWPKPGGRIYRSLERGLLRQIFRKK